MALILKLQIFSFCADVQQQYLTSSANLIGNFITVAHSMTVTSCDDNCFPFASSLLRTILFCFTEVLCQTSKSALL